MSMTSVRRLARKLATLLILIMVAYPAAATTRYDIRQPGAGESPRYWVVLMARPADLAAASPGHAFVEFGYEDEAAQMTRFEAWGFYPEADGKTFQAVPGRIVDDVRSGSLSARTILVSVEVSKEAFEAARRVRQDWSDRPPEYHLLSASNCIDFVDRLARAVGLVTPARSVTQRPEEYVEALGRMNQ